MRARLAQLLPVALVFAAPPSAAPIDVRQGSSAFSIQPLRTSAGAAGYYAYDTTHRSSADTGLEASQTSLLFFHERTTGSPAPLSLFVIHDLHDDFSGGDVVFRFSGLPAGTFYAVRDDPTGPMGGDSYSPDPPAGGASSVEWRWADCCTDGAVLGGFEGDRFCTAVEPSFGSGISRWQLLGGPGLPSTRIDLPSLTRTVYLCQDCLDLSCPGQITAECSGNGEAFVNLSATGSSLCGAAGIVNDRTSGGANASGLYPLGTTVVRFTLTDGPGFSSTCETRVIVQDTIPPVVDACPVPLKLPCDGKPIPVSDPRVVAWVALFQASDVCGPVTLANDLPAELPPSCGGAGVPVAFTAVDGVGLSAACSSTVTVEDLLPPEITSCPGATSLECSDPTGVPRTDPRLVPYFVAFTARDDCSGVTLGDDAPAAFPAACSPGQTTPVTFTAEDGCRKTASCASSVTVVDSTPPDIACPAATSVECSQTGGTPAADPAVDAWRRSAAAMDLCGPASLADDLPAFLASACAPGQAHPTTFTAEDGCGLESSCSETITVLDSTPPVVTACPLPIQVECTTPAGVPATDRAIASFLAGFTAADVCSAVTTGNDAPAVFPPACGAGQTTPVAFQAQDGCLLAAGCASAVTVADTSPPVITACPAPLVLECDAPGGIPVTDSRIQTWLASFAAADACGAVSLASDAPSFFASGCGAGQTTTVHFTAEDGCGLLSTCAATVTVRDTKAPVISTCPAPLTLECSAPGGIPASDPRVQAWLASFRAADACGVAALGNDAPGFFPSGCGAGFATAVTFTATDGCGLASACTAELRVRDTTPPVVTACPATLTLECDGPGGIPAADPRIQAWLAGFQASDGCSTVAIANDAPAVFVSGCGAGHATTVKFEATDGCGSTASCQADLVVRDTLPPAITACPLELDLECSVKGGVPASDPRVQAWAQGFTAVDVCDGVTRSNDLPALLPSGCAAGRRTPVSFRAEDNCANAAGCASGVTVHDRTPPRILSCPAPLVLECLGGGGVDSSDPRVQAWLATFAADDVCGTTTLAHDLPPFVPASCPPGTPVAVAFRAVDDCGNVAACASSLTVLDSTPPEVERNRLDGICLWPPNHKMFCIDDIGEWIEGTDLCSATKPTARVVSCSSNQPDDAPGGKGPGTDKDNGDGHTTGDCRIQDGGRGVCIRSERLGGDPAGRRYALIVELADACGNAASVTATVEVPHDQSPGRDCERPGERDE